MRLAAATALTGAAVGAALIGQPASAQSGSSVEFAGSCGVAGLGLLGGNAVSNPGQLSVPAGAEVAFTNGFDRLATLHVNGAATTLVGPGDAAAITFEDGPATVTMQIKCPVGGKAASATVEVVGADQPVSPVPPGPSTGSAPAAGSAAPPADPAPGQPRQPGPGAGTGSPGSERPGSDPGAWQAFVVPPAPGQGQHGDAERKPRDAADRAGEPGDEELGARWRDQGGAPSAGPDTVDQQADDVVVTDRLASTAGSPEGNGPIGLLALVATICVVGVSAGAVRAIIAQRASAGVA